MFIPLGGVFVIGGCNTRGCVINRIFMSFFNIAMGAIALGLGYAQDLVFLQIIGYIIVTMGLLMFFFNIFKLRNAANEEPQQIHHIDRSKTLFH